MKGCFNPNCNNSEPIYKNEVFEHYWHCPECGAKGPIGKDKKDAEDKWDSILRFHDFFEVTCLGRGGYSALLYNNLTVYGSSYDKVHDYCVKYLKDEFNV